MRGCVAWRRQAAINFRKTLYAINSLPSETSKNLGFSSKTVGIFPLERKGKQNSEICFSFGVAMGEG
jgi:hypothetical protein